MEIDARRRRREFLDYRRKGGFMGWLSRLFGRRTPVDIPDPDAYELTPIEDFRTAMSGAIADRGRRQSAIRRCQRGDRLLLDREPDNRQDPNAVAVVSQMAERLGFIPAHVAEDLARRMDAGDIATAEVLEVRPPTAEYNFYNLVLRIRVYRIGG
jgi:hypothetical protein